MDSSLSITHPLKVFDLAKSQGRLVFTSAPMVRYSKLAFRQTVYSYGVDLCWTPMILAKEFNRNQFARDSDFTLSTQASQPPTIVQFGANSPTELARAASLVAPFASGIDLNCGCPQSWACAETLGAALMEQRELVRGMVTATRARLRDDGWGVNLAADEPRGRTVSVKIRVHNDLRRTIDFLDTVIGDPHRRNVDFLTIHPRTRRTASTTPIDLDALSLLTDRYGDVLPILVSGDVFTLDTLPFASPLLTSTTNPRKEGEGKEGGKGEEVEEKAQQEGRGRPMLPKLAGLMSARAILANPALYAGHGRCPWEAVEVFINKVVRAPLPFKLVLHHISEMCGPGFGPDKTALLSKKERVDMMACTTMCDLLDFIDDKASRGMKGREGGLKRIDS